MVILPQVLYNILPVKVNNNNIVCVCVCVLRFCHKILQYKHIFMDFQAKVKNKKIIVTSVNFWFKFRFCLKKINLQEICRLSSLCQVSSELPSLHLSSRILSPTIYSSAISSEHLFYLAASPGKFMLNLFQAIFLLSIRSI